MNISENFETPKFYWIYTDYRAFHLQAFHLQKL